MAGFHVFVEGATDGSPAGIKRLAEAIAKQYGMPTAELLTRLQKGRFRVKSNAERATAEQYARDLERLGARCTIEEATAENSQRMTPTPFPVQKPTTLPPQPSTLKPAEKPLPPKPATLPAAEKPLPPKPATLPPTDKRPSTPQFQSGLAAAFTSDTPATGLGALEQDGIAFSLAAVDGGDDAPLTGAAEHLFAPPGGAAPASSGPTSAKPAQPKPDNPKAAKPKDVPLDLFTPPDAEAEEFKVDIAADELEVSARKRVASQAPEPVPSPATDSLRKPEGVRARAPSEPVVRMRQPGSGPVPRAGSQPASGPIARASSQATSVSPRAPRFGPLGEPRVRFAVGVVLALVLGFVPAHFVAAMREHSAYAAIDDKVRATQELADTPETYATLDRMRAAQLDVKYSARSNAAIIAFAIWAALGGAIAFLWFRKIPWDR